MPLREMISRRNLPHWFVPTAWHFVTYRLAGTIPNVVLHHLREARDIGLKKAKECGEATPARREALHKSFFAAYDRYLDHNVEADWLSRPKISAMIRENLYHHHGHKYHLLAFSIMPNHVHVLLRAIESETMENQVWLPPDANSVMPDEAPDSTGPLTAIMHSLKSYTANKANELLQRTGQFWQHESYDHWVRDEEELERIVTYIAWNPVKANLVKKPHEWVFSSAHDRFLHDGEEEGYLFLA